MSPEIGDYVIIADTAHSSWSGTWKVVKVYEKGIISIVHPNNGKGTFYPSDYTLITSKLHKILK